MVAPAGDEKAQLGGADRSGVTDPGGKPGER